ncbi:uncharacterized protein LOC126318701 [Schistocerca gregaria]|uniref:uncharacterized protein LOC126318701 n=1 Tax=Schistocerca gregaria TaxID=7010 RepID=UPI00211E4BB9|nr:uncharacterized protein LOC126318701 [Schistocerca gregaria]
MDVESAEELLDYVFTEKDFSLKPDHAEYQKLTRIMVIMTQFYRRGSEGKKAALDKEVSRLNTLDQDARMIEELLESIRGYSLDYPKRLEYEKSLKQSLEEVEKLRREVRAEEKKWRELYEWSCKIVETMDWIGGWLKEYSNTEFKTDFESVPEQQPLSVDLYRIYKRGLEEITYNLQESQDFFDASLDGRLTKYHQVNRDMIRAQLAVLERYDGESAYRRALEESLLKDLEYIESHMEMGPRVVRVREKMREMHQDFFALLKWQRERMLRLPFEARHKLVGDVEGLQRELRCRSGETLAEVMDYRLVPDDEHSRGRSEGGEVGRGELECPGSKGEEAGCPMEAAVEKLKIHRLCE